MNEQKVKVGDVLLCTKTLEVTHPPFGNIVTKGEKYTVIDVDVEVSLFSIHPDFDKLESHWFVYNDVMKGDPIFIKQQPITKSELPEEEKEELDRVYEILFDLFPNVNYIAFDKDGLINLSTVELTKKYVAWGVKNCAVENYIAPIVNTTFNYEKYWDLSQVKRSNEYIEGGCYKLIPNDEKKRVYYGEYIDGKFWCGNLYDNYIV